MTIRLTFRTFAYLMAFAWALWMAFWTWKVAERLGGSLKLELEIPSLREPTRGTSAPNLAQVNARTRIAQWR
jgi:hypothetical protein